MLRTLWQTTRLALRGYIDDACVSRGAAIAYYTTVSLAPVLLIAISIAGAVFGDERARKAVMDQIGRVVGFESAGAVDAMLQAIANRHVGMLASVIGAIALLLAASGVFTEMQSALNAIWKAKAPHRRLVGVMRQRLQSLILVLALGGLLLISLIATTALATLGDWLSLHVPGWRLVLRIAYVGLSCLLLVALISTIYKVLPDTEIAWRDVGIGATITTILLTIGKTLIGFYIGRAGIATTYGAAGALGVILIWIYYSSQIFLFGAELTWAYAELRGSRAVRRHAAELARLRSLLHANRKPPVSATR